MKRRKRSLALLWLTSFRGEAFHDADLLAARHPHDAIAVQKSTMRCSAQKRSLPEYFEMKPQWPPCWGATNWMAGFSLILAAKNEAYGTKGSSCAVIMSVGTRIWAATRLAPTWS